MAEWGKEEVAARFVEAAETARRLPPVRVRGYFNVWPAFKREAWEGFGQEDDVYRPLTPTPEAIDRMLETMRWVQWLEVDERHLVWMRAKRYRWVDIAKRFACASRTAQRRFDAAMHLIAMRLNVGDR